MGIRCKRPKKLELEHDDGPDYDEGKKQVHTKLQTDSISSLSLSLSLKNKKVMLVVFEDETIVTQKPCIRKSMNEF